MSFYSSREAADRLRIHLRTLERYIAGKRIPYPPIQQIGGVRFRLWSDEDVEVIRQLLPTIKNVRKKRRQSNTQGD
jgi:predicted site-specific integrase-resolvase